ncbi:cation diffusion facilitator family transporter [Desulfitobacterium metallireducens]|uniref:Cation diffusion facilitator family transporter n=1 Tax=Desulfitobacterium metallireducens DSM 15288 TaxID=871968 RepID=W0E6W0_9FIRM|nr:cation diffusion facilitator family transporter [Desulfitobacterium metallireducens]AHF06507.1 cation diffusion facilitator family transporter [Desulfitobacterium metallireducens DSM 15288]
MIKLIVKTFINNYEAIQDKKVREAYGVLGGILGVICNLLLFILKLTIGMLSNSIAVISDAFNNLSDLGSSLISIIGAKMSNRPPDPEHPFGHGRFEYISSLVVSFLIFSVGFQLFKSSISKILAPEKVVFNSALIIILAFSILVKLWMFSYNRYIGKTINSSIQNATAFDSLNDVLATSAVLLTTLISHYFNFSIDGIVGLAISVLILYTGLQIAKDTINLLLGSAPDSALVQDIKTRVSSGQYIVGTHDLKVHDYGPGRILASIHAEFPDTISTIEAHSIVDDLEDQISNQLGINMVVHIDPLSTNTEKLSQVNVFVNQEVRKINDQFCVQHIRITEGLHKTNIIFSIVVPSDIKESEYKGISQTISKRLMAAQNHVSIVVDSVVASNT